MRYLFILLLFLAACRGGDDGDRASTGGNGAETPASEATAPASPTGQQPDVSSGELVAALLSVGDLPTGWTINVSEEEDDDEQHYCGWDKEDIATPIGEATVDFQQSETGPFLSQELSVYTGDDAELVTDAFRKLPLDCPGWTITDEDGTETEWKLTALSFPKVGDETVSIRLASSATFLGIVEIDGALVRSGNIINLVYYAVLGFEGIDSQQSEQFVRLADQKLRAAD